jgi:hypothetical protein
VKLRGRTTTPARRRGRTLSSSARGAKQTTPHGPLRRLLEVAIALAFAPSVSPSNIAMQLRMRPLLELIEL